MNFYKLALFLIPAASIPVLAYLIVKCICSYEQKTRGKLLLYFSLSLGIMALSMGLYSIRPFLREGQDLLAELSLGGSVILLIISLVIYIEYWHTLYRKIPIFSNIFYISIGGAFVSILFHPWEISYINFFGYIQCISALLLFFLAIQILCLFIIICNVIVKIKEGIDNEILYSSDSVNQRINTEKEEVTFKNRKQELINNKKRFNHILVAYFVGVIFGLAGLIIQGPNLGLDAISILIVYIPQAYILSKDKDIFKFLLAQKIREDTLNFQRNLYLLQEESLVHSQLLSNEIQNLIKFIEKADMLISKKES